MHAVPLRVTAPLECMSLGHQDSQGCTPCSSALEEEMKQGNIAQVSTMSECSVLPEIH
jgi:hypothetical protein